MKFKNYLIGIVILLGAFLPLFCNAQEMVFSASANAKRVGLEDEVEITFSFQNVPHISDFQLPDFPGFTLIAGPFQSQRSNISIVNGRRQQTTALTLTYVLKPTIKGNHTIPPAKVTVDHQVYQTNAVSIEVVEGRLNRRQRQSQADPFFDEDPFEAMQQQMQRMRDRMMPQPRQQEMMNPEELSEENVNKNVFIKVEVDKTDPYVGEQITAYYKLYTRLPMNLSLSKLPTLNGFWAEDFDIPSPPQAQEETIDGKLYQVFLLKKSALFPQHSGNLVLDPAEAEGIVGVVEKTRSNNPYAPAYRQKEIPLKISSRPISISVKALPTANQPEGFNGAVGQFEVNAKVDTSHVSTDQSIQYSFEISGSGNLHLMGNPDLEFPKNFKVYEPEVTDTIVNRSNILSGKKVYKHSLNPQFVGNVVIPSFDFHFFDPKEKKYKTISTKEIEIMISQGEETTISGSNLPENIHGIITTDLLTAKPKMKFSNSWIYWILYPVFSISLFIVVWWHNRQQRLQSNISLWKHKKANKIAWKRLSKARKLLNQQNHITFYEEVSKAVWLYLSDKSGIPLSALSKENIRIHLLEKGIEQNIIDQTNEVISECEMALYSPSGSQQQKTEILASAVELIGKFEKDLKTT